MPGGRGRSQHSIEVGARAAVERAREGGDAQHPVLGGVVVPLERLVVEHLLQEADDLHAGGVADEVHRVLLVPDRVVPALVYPAEPGVPTRPAVLLSVVHLPSFQVVEQLSSPALMDEIIPDTSSSEA
jgi:hypothetical protein